MNPVIESLQKIDWASMHAPALKILSILIFTWIIAKIVYRAITKSEYFFQKTHIEGDPLSESDKRIDTVIRLIRQGILFLIWMISGLMILRELSVDIAPILASAGIVGVALGFGAQALVRDVISGFFMIVEDQIRVGDVATINGTSGTVECIKFRTTMLRDMSGSVHIFPNGTIATLSNLTKDWSAYVFEIGVGYKTDIGKAKQTLHTVGTQMREHHQYRRLITNPVEIFGVQQLGSSAVVIKGRLKTVPGSQWGIGREFLARTKVAFEDENIEIPFDQLTVNIDQGSLLDNKEAVK